MEIKKGGKTGLLILLVAFTHAVFYLAPTLYLPFGLDDLFFLGHALVFIDSGLAVLFGVKLLNRYRARNQTKG